MRKNISFRKLFFIITVSLIVSFFYAAGRELDCTGNMGIKHFFIRWLLIFFLQIFIIWLVWSILEKWEHWIEFRMRNAYKTWYIWEQYGYILSIFFLILCWLPEFLSIFPGAFSYDAYAEWQQVATGNLTAHHPVIHVLVLGYLLEWGHGLAGSYNIGIGCYSILQMLLLANTFAYTVRFLHNRKVPIVAQLSMLLFYGISPVIQLLSNCATKDTLFAASQLLFMLCLLHFRLERKQFFSSRTSCIMFVLSALGTMILRNNGLYIVMIVLVIFIINSKEERGHAIMMVTIIATCYALYVGPCYHALNVTLGGVEEMLSVPIQQLARVHKYSYDDLTAEDKELLYQILPEAALNSYRSTVSDFVKKDFQREAFEQNKYDFFGLWLKLGIKHPFTYVNSFLVNTVDFWYPFAVIDGYQNGYANYFDYRVAEPGTYVEIMPRLHAFYEYLSFDKEAQKLPLLFLLLSPGWYWVVFFVLFAYFWYRRQWWKLTVLSVPLLNMLTVLLGPMALVRYVLILFYGAPLYIIMALFPFQQEQMDRRRKKNCAKANTYHMSVRKRILSFFVMALCAAATLKILFVGYDIDEQYAVSMVYRLLRGDRLLTDLWEPHQTSGWLCMLLMAPYVAIFHTTTGIILYLRLWGLLLHGTVCFCLYRTLKSYLDQEHTLLVCGIYFFALPKIMFLPEFSNIQVWCLLMTVLCLLQYYGPSDSQPGRYALHHLVFAGCFLALEVLSYPSTLLTFGACVVCMVCYRRRSPHSLVRELSCLAAPCLLGAMAFLVILFSYIPLGELGNLISIVASDGSHSAPWGERLQGHGQSLKQILLFLLGYSLVAFLLQLLYRLKTQRPFSSLLWCELLMGCTLVGQVCIWVFGNRYPNYPMVEYIFLPALLLFAALQRKVELSPTLAFFVLVPVTAFMGILLFSNHPLLVSLPFLAPCAVGILSTSAAENLNFKKHRQTPTYVPVHTGTMGMRTRIWKMLYAAYHRRTP